MPEAKIDVQYRFHRPIPLAALPLPTVIVSAYILLEVPKPPTQATYSCSLVVQFALALKIFPVRSVHAAIGRFADADCKSYLGLCLPPWLPRA